MARGRFHRVKRGDTYEKIAAQYGLDSALLANRNSSVKRLIPGMGINIPNRPSVLRPQQDAMRSNIGNKFGETSARPPLTRADFGPYSQTPTPTPTPNPYTATPTTTVAPVTPTPTAQPTQISWLQESNAKTASQYEQMKWFDKATDPTTADWSKTHTSAEEEKWYSDPANPLGSYSPGNVLEASSGYKREKPEPPVKDASKHGPIQEWGYDKWRELEDQFATYVVEAAALGEWGTVNKYTGNVITDEDGNIHYRDGQGRIYATIAAGGRSTSTPGETGHGNFNYYPGPELGFEEGEYVDPMAMGGGGFVSRSGGGGATAKGRSWKGAWKYAVKKGWSKGPDAWRLGADGYADEDEETEAGANDDIVVPPTPTPEQEAQTMISLAGIEYNPPSPDSNLEFAGFTMYDGVQMVWHKINSPGYTEQAAEIYYQDEVFKLSGKDYKELFRNKDLTDEERYALEDEFQAYMAQVEPFEAQYDDYEGMYVLRPEDIPEGFDFDSWLEKYDINYFISEDGYVLQYPPLGLGDTPWAGDEPQLQSFGKQLEERAIDVQNQKEAEAWAIEQRERAKRMQAGRMYKPREREAGVDYNTENGYRLTQTMSYARNLSPTSWRVRA